MDGAICEENCLLYFQKQSGETWSKENDIIENIVQDPSLSTEGH